MHNFQNVPPEETRGNSLPLHRCPTGRAIKGIITCSDMLGTATQFYHGRTVPFDSENSDDCSNGLPWRWHGYVSLFLPKSKHHILFEMTAKACEPLKDYREANQTLRGCILFAKRASLAPNARVIIETSTADLQEHSIPKEPHLLEALSILWNIPLSSMQILGTNKDAPALQVEPLPASKRFNPDYAKTATTDGNGDE